MYITQAHYSYHNPNQIQMLGKGGVMWSVDLLPYLISREQLLYFCLVVQFRDVLGNVMEMRLMKKSVR